MKVTATKNQKIAKVIKRKKIQRRTFLKMAMRKMKI